MLPTYKELQLILLDKTPTDIERGDVVLFYCEELENILMIKRVIALPNDIVVIADGIVYVNGEASEVVFDNGEISYSGIADTPLKLPENEYFVMGDNHKLSVDSRYEEIGCITDVQIVGKAIAY